MATKPSTAPVGTTRDTVGLDLAAHPVKRRLLATICRLNELGHRPSIADVIRVASQDRADSRYRASRWRANVHSLADAGYVSRCSTPRGYELTVTPAGREALDDSE